ncbi:hypothetical protein [Methylocystis parvus]|uniref:hypothetical protein n=1 Tax=Methylocystis parvus TaxID=134 RepID=UPI003C775667
MRRMLLISSASIICLAAAAAVAAGESRMGEKIIMAEGMTVHIDPKTGKIVPPPEGAAPLSQSPSEKDSTSTSSEGLKEEPGAHGGAKVDLKGRFQNR